MIYRLYGTLLIILAIGHTELLSAPVPLPKDERSPEEIEAARSDLRSLRRRVADPTIDTVELWKLWAQFRMRHAGTPEYMQAAEAMRKVPSPLDRLDRSQIPAEDRPPWLPKEVVAVLGDHRGRSWGDFQRLRFSRDGKLLLSGWQTWDANTLRERSNPLKGAVMAPDGKRAAILERVTSPEAKRHLYLDSSIRILDVDGDKRIVRAELQRTGHRLDHLEWSPDGRLLLASGRIYPMFREGGHSDRRDVRQQSIVCEFKAKELHVVHEIDVEAGGGSQVAFAVDGKFLLDNGGEKESLRLWDLRGDKPKLSSTIPNDWRRRFSLNADGKTLALRQSSKLRGINADAVGVWSLTETGPRGPRLFEGTWPALGRTQVSPDGELLVCLAAETKGLWLCPLTETRRRELGMGKGQDSKFYPLAFIPQAIAFDPDSRKLAIGGTDRIIHLWDWKNGEKVFPHAGQHGDVSGISFSPDGLCLASGGADGTIRLWEWHEKDARQLHCVDTGRPVRNLAFAPEGKLLAVCSPSVGGRKDAERSLISFWDTSKCRPLHRVNLEPHSEDQGFTSMAFAAHGNILLTTGNGKDPLRDNYSIGTACLWNYASLPPQLLSRIVLEDVDKTEDNRVTDVDLSTLTLSPSGKQLTFVKGRREQSVEIWERRGQSWGKGLEVNFDLDERIYCLAFSPDGQQLMIGGSGRRERRDLLASSYPLIRFRKLRDRGGEARASLTDDGYTAIERLLVSPTASHIAARHGARITGWDILTGTRVLATELPSRCNEMCFAPDGRHLAIANPNGTIYIFRIPKQTSKP